jgi:prepilin-type N-terminal cleavage/methylation domain-containing protein
MKYHTPQQRRQAGFTFIELSFVIIVMGMIAMLVAQVVPAMRRSSATAETVRNLSNVELSLQSFAAINGRLPCADTDNDGLENASGSCAVIGKLPYRTLGYSSPLVNADGFDFKYALYVNPGSALRDKAMLGNNTERYRPSIGVDTPPVTLTDKTYTLSNRRLDFCQGLRAGMDAGFTASYLHVQTPAGGRKNVAYVLVDPGVGDMDLNGDVFDGLNSSATVSLPRFEHPNRQQSMTYDDRVVVGYFDQMWESLGCSANMATAGRALPNIETMLALLKQSSVDYHTQLDIGVDMAFADNFSAGAGIAMATTGLLSSGASMATDIASAINTFGVTSGAAVSAGIAIGLNAAALAVAIANQVVTVLNYNAFKGYRTDFETLVSTKLNPLYTSVQTDVANGLNNVYSDN